MPSEPKGISVRFSDEFEENVYTLSKRYRSIRADIQLVIEQLQAGTLISEWLTPR